MLCCMLKLFILQPRVYNVLWTSQPIQLRLKPYKPFRTEHIIYFLPLDFPCPPPDLITTSPSPPPRPPVLPPVSMAADCARAAKLSEDIWRTAIAFQLPRVSRTERNTRASTRVKLRACEDWIRGASDFVIWIDIVDEYLTFIEV